MSRRSRIALSIVLVVIAVGFAAARADTLGVAPLAGIAFGVGALVIFLAWDFLRARVDRDDDDPGQWWRQ